MQIMHEDYYCACIKYIFILMYNLLPAYYSTSQHKKLKNE